MRVEELMEAPLPDSWDHDIYNERVPFKKRVEYAKERAEQVGRGSSRTAFKIPYQGKPTVLKIANSRRGMVQNDEEAKLMDDWYMQSIGIVVPLIDYDERNSAPTWIHTAYAPKITQKRLESFFGGVSMSAITGYLDKLQGRNRYAADIPEELHENEYFQMLQDLVLNYGLPAGDLARKANWGLYKGQKPVIIDLGYTDETAKYY